MEYRDVWVLVWQTLKETNWGTSGDLVSLAKGVRRRARDRGLAPLTDDPDPQLGEADWPLLYDVFWELVIQRVVAPGHPVGHTQPTLPHFHVTEHGRRCLQSGDILHFDPWGYTEQIGGIVREIDEEGVIQLYVSQAVRALGADCHLAAAVMVGVVSESALEVLFQSFAEALETEEQRNKFREQLNKTRTLRRRYDAFKERLNSIALPPRLDEGIKRKLDGAFELITTTRNNAGHWLKVEVRRDDVEGNLILLRGYLKLIVELIGHYRAHRGNKEAASLPQRDEGATDRDSGG
jgi:hypothetical protein